MSTLVALPPQTGNKQLDDWIREVTQIVSGLGGGSTGSLDSSNMSGYHNGDVGGHKNIIQADDLSDETQSATSVTSADAGVTYTAAEQTLINELKADLNTIISDINAFKTRYNQHLAAHRTQKLFK